MRRFKVLIGILSIPYGLFVGIVGYVLIIAQAIAKKSTESANATFILAIGLVLTGILSVIFNKQKLASFILGGFYIIVGIIAIIFHDTFPILILFGAIAVFIGICYVVIQILVNSKAKKIKPENKDGLPA